MTYTRGNKLNCG